MFDKFITWFRTNYFQITWFSIGYLTMAGMAYVSQGDLFNAIICWAIAVANWLLNKY